MNFVWSLSARLTLALLIMTCAAQAAYLTVRFGQQERVFSQAELLQAPTARDVAIPQTSLHAQAVPLLDLFDGLLTDDADTLDVQAWTGLHRRYR